MRGGVCGYLNNCAGLCYVFKTEGVFSFYVFLSSLSVSPSRAKGRERNREVLRYTPSKTERSIGAPGPQVK